MDFLGDQRFIAPPAHHQGRFLSLLNGMTQECPSTSFEKGLVHIQAVEIVHLAQSVEFVSVGTSSLTRSLRLMLRSGLPIKYL